jgi:hypothetical protein
MVTMHNPVAVPARIRRTGVADAIAGSSIENG